MDYGRETIRLLEIDQPLCARTYGQSPCAAALGATGTRKCFNTRFTCQDPENYSPGVIRLRFSNPQEGVLPYGPLIPSLADDLSTTPASINLAAMDRSASALGSREVVTIKLDDHLHSDHLVDPYRLERISGVAQKNADAYLSLPGTSGNYASTPDSAAIAITGDIQIYVHAALIDWTPGTINTLIAKRSAAGAGSTSYAFYVDTTGKLGFLWSDGVTITTVLSTAAPTVADGADLWVGVELCTVNDFAGGNFAAFFAGTAVAPATPQLGATVSNAFHTSIRNGADPVEIGGQYGGTSNLVNGKIYYAEVHRFVDVSTLTGDVTVLRFDPNAGATGAGSFTS